MRWLFRIVMTWAVILVLGYFYGLPEAAKYLLGRTQNETMAQCAQQLQAQKLVGMPGAPLTAETASHYCHCLADPLTLDRNDMIEMLRQYRKTGERQPPARLLAQVKTQVEACNPQLQHDIVSKSSLSVPADPSANAPSTYLIH